MSNLQPLEVANRGSETQPQPQDEIDDISHLSKPILSEFMGESFSLCFLNLTERLTVVSDVDTLYR